MDYQGANVNIEDLDFEAHWDGFIDTLKEDNEFCMIRWIFYNRKIAEQSHKLFAVYKELGLIKMVHKIPAPVLSVYVASSIQ